MTNQRTLTRRIMALPARLGRWLMADQPHYRGPNGEITNDDEVLTGPHAPA